MANLSDLNLIITDLFGVLSTLISGVVDLMTGDLLVLGIVAGFISLILGIIALIYQTIKNSTNNSVKMK